MECRTSGVPTDTQPQASLVPSTQILHCPQCPGPDSPARGWGLPPSMALGVYLGFKAFQGEKRRSRGSGQPLVWFYLQRCSRHRDPSLAVQWQGTQAGEGVKDGRCQLQKFYHIWRLFLKAQLLAACETPGSHWRYGCAVSPHGRGSLSPPCREGFALGKGNNHSENFLLGFVVACWGRKIISWRGGDVGCSLPSRQTRGAAGGRRDRLQELHQENPVGTSWPWDVPPAEGAGVQGGCHVPLSSTQMSPGCCGTPVALAEKS